MPARKPQLKHRHIVHLSRLMNMLYTPAEVAREIGVTPDTVYRSYLPAGLPHDRDHSGEIWIHGLTFVKWAESTIAKRKPKRAPLPEGQVWCLTCRGPVPLLEPKVRTYNFFLELLQSKCPQCGGRVNRARAVQHGAQGRAE